MLSNGHYTGEYPARHCAQAARREVIACVAERAYGRYVNAAFGYSERYELTAVAFLQVDMPFVLANAYAAHVESCGGELFIHFVAHLERVERNARPDYGFQRFGA